MRGTLTRVETATPAAALTFDDGPDPQATPAILDVLARHGARATFFMVGRRAAAHPDVVAAVRRAGHSIGIHGWSHRALPDLSWADRSRELRHAIRTLAPTCRLMRPPYGRQTAWTHLHARLLGQRVVAWSVDVDDCSATDADDLAGRLMARVQPGDIVLPHDGLIDRDGADRASRGEGGQRPASGVSSPLPRFVRTTAPRSCCAT